MALFDDYTDGRAYKNARGKMGVLTLKNRESKEKHYGDKIDFFDCQVVLWYPRFAYRQDPAKEKLLRHKAHLLAKKGTSVRSNWRTFGKTWDEIARWESSLTERRIFDFLRGETVLEATTSDGYSTRYLNCNKGMFGFAKVIGCSDFYDFSLRERNSYDAIVTNPPWDEGFLKIFYQYLFKIGKPFVLILRSSGTRHKMFVDVFGKGSHTTVVTN